MVGLGRSDWLGAIGKEDGSGFGSLGISTGPGAVTEMSVLGISRGGAKGVGDLGRRADFNGGGCILLGKGVVDLLSFV